MLYISEKLINDLPNYALQILPLTSEGEQIIFEKVFYALSEEHQKDKRAAFFICEHIVTDPRAKIILKSRRKSKDFWRYLK